MYFVTTLKRINNDFSDCNSVRTVGFYSKFEDAEYDVLNNTCDINEATYDYAIIKKLKEGLYPFSINSFLYKFDYDTKKYIPISSEELSVNDTFAQVG